MQIKNLLVCFLFNCLPLLILKKYFFYSYSFSDAGGQSRAGFFTNAIWKKNRISFFTSSSSGLSSYTDSNGVVHVPVPFSPAKGSWCGIKTGCYSLCHMEGKANSGGWGPHSWNVCNKAFCCPSAQNSNRDCFCKHVVTGSYLWRLNNNIYPLFIIYLYYN